MNDEASSSAAAAPSTSRRHGDGEPAQTTSELAERRKKSRQLFNRKRGERLDDLLANLDMLIYAELSVIYYMEYVWSRAQDRPKYPLTLDCSCSFLRFLIRAFLQFLYLTPKAPILPEPSVDKAVLGPILGSNLLCLVLHIWLSAPSAGEATRGYLHGGLAMDFIGQKGPTSKVHLVLLDFSLLVLQLVMLPASIQRRKLRGAATITEAVSATAPSNATSASRQNLDSEERGVRRSQEEDGIELHNLSSSGRNDASAQEGIPEEREGLLAPPRPQPANDTAIIDMFNSGQITLIDIDMWQSVKDQAQLMRHPPPPREASSREQRTLRAEIAGRMLRMRFGAGGMR